MAKMSDRSQQLSEYGLSETALASLFTNKEPDEALWLAEHELKMHCAWAVERHQFILDEIEKQHPSWRQPKKLPPIVGPPIVSHRGRNRGSSVFGESMG